MFFDRRKRFNGDVAILLRDFEIDVNDAPLGVLAVLDHAWLQKFNVHEDDGIGLGGDGAGEDVIIVGIARDRRGLGGFGQLNLACGYFLCQWDIAFIRNG